METHHHKYSLFKIEKEVSHNYLSNLEIMQPCFEYIDTFDTLTLAKFAQEKIKEQTIILESH